MADQESTTSAAVVGQQGQTSGLKGSQETKQARTPGVKQGKGKSQQSGKQPHQGQGHKRGAGLRTAEIGASGKGFVKLIKENFGFISSPELEEQLFFHASELLPPDGHEGAPIPFKDAIAAGDEVEYIVGQNTGKRSNFVAKQVKKLPLNSVKAQLLSEERYLGTVTRELNSGQWRSEASSSGQITYQEPGADGQPGKEASLDFFAADTHRLRPGRQLPKGTLVEFNICTDNQTKQRRAVHIAVKAAQLRSVPAEATQNGSAGHAVQPLVLHGFIRSMKPQTGFISCVERDRKFTFKKSDVPSQHLEKLQPGAEVMFTVLPDGPDNDTVISVAVLPSGTLPAEQVSPGPVQGTVVRPISPPGSEKTEDGLVFTSGDDGSMTRVAFKAGPLEDSQEDAASLAVDDEVEFTLVHDLKWNTCMPRGLRLLCRAAERRELGKVRTLKGNFGFIRCCQRAGDLFFHFTALQNCQVSDLQKGDDVEFTVSKDPEHGVIAVGVKKMPPGSAVFETISEEEHTGVIHSLMFHISPVAVSNGVVSFPENGAPAKILYGQHDFKDKVSAGDHVTFRIANNVNAAKQAEKLGAKVSKLVGRRATQGALLKLSGVVKQLKSGYGFIRYTAKGGGGERSVFFHSSEVADNLVLKPGDEVSFGLSDNPKTKEVNARRVVRTKEAPAVAPEDSVAERNPQAMKFTSSNAGGTQVVVRMAAMPDGTRGFTTGRGSALKPPLSEPSTSGAVDIPGRGKAPGAPAAGLNGIAAANGTSPLSASGHHSRSLPSLQRLSLDGSSPASLHRTASGRSLNPAAPSFMPKAPPVAAAVERESPADAVKRESPADAVKRESPAVAVERDSPEGGGSQMPPCEVGDKQP